VLKDSEKKNKVWNEECKERLGEEKWEKEKGEKEKRKEKIMGTGWGNLIVYALLQILYCSSITNLVKFALWFYLIILMKVINLFYIKSIYNYVSISNFLIQTKLQNIKRMGLKVL